MYFPTGCKFEPAIHPSWTVIVPQRFWSHDLECLGERDVISQVTIGLAIYGFLQVIVETIPLCRCCRTLPETLGVKGAAKHIPIENALKPIFVFFRCKIGGYKNIP